MEQDMKRMAYEEKMRQEAELHDLRVEEIKLRIQLMRDKHEAELNKLMRYS